MSVWEDRAELVQLTARYAHAVDRRDAAAVAELFVPGGVVVVPAELTGTGSATELVPGPQVIEPLERFVRTRHEVYQQHVEITNGRAVGETYATAHHVSARDGRLRDMVVALRYLDDVVRIDAGWRLARRELVVDWSTVVDVGRLGRQPTG